MARKPRRQTDVQKKYQYGRPGRPRRGRPRKQESRNGMDFDELVSVVCKLFCKGHTASEIRDLTEERYHVVMSREEPYQLLSYAASNGWMRFNPPFEHALREQIRTQYDWLQDVHVVHTGVNDDVAFRGAEMLLRMVKQLHRRHRRAKAPVHIGFAGGHAMRKVAQYFAQLLCQPLEDMPEKLIFHAMAAGFNVHDPTTAPNAFFSYFVGNPALTVTAEFVGLHAPGVVRTKQLSGLRDTAGIRESFDLAGQLEIVVTSGSLWPHSMLRQYAEKSESSLTALEKAGCLGDMLWQPLGANGPISVNTEIRAMTLMELAELPPLLDRGGNVLLVLGPCGRCNKPKTAILRSVLNATPPLVTHLVVDSRVARTVVQAE